MHRPKRSFFKSIFNIEAFFEKVDLSRNMLAAMHATDGIYGFHAGMLAVCFLLLAILFATLAWIFDLSSTYQWSLIFTSWAQEDITDAFHKAFSTTDYFFGFAAPISFLQAFQIVIVMIITISATILELTSGRLVKMNVAFIESIVWFALGFDALTDLPKTAAFVDVIIYPSFVSVLGENLATVFYYPFLFPIWILSTLVYELLTLIFWVLVIKLIYQASNNKPIVTQVGSNEHIP